MLFKRAAFCLAVVLATAMLWSAMQNTRAAPIVRMLRGRLRRFDSTFITLSSLTALHVEKRCMQLGADVLDLVFGHSIKEW